MNSKFRTLPWLPISTPVVLAPSTMYAFSRPVEPYTVKDCWRTFELSVLTPLASWVDVGVVAAGRQGLEGLLVQVAADRIRLGLDGRGLGGHRHFRRRGRRELDGQGRRPGSRPAAPSRLLGAKPSRRGASRCTCPGGSERQVEPSLRVRHGRASALQVRALRLDRDAGKGRVRRLHDTADASGRLAGEWSETDRTSGRTPRTGGPRVFSWSNSLRSSVFPYAMAPAIAVSSSQATRIRLACRSGRAA